MLAKRLKAARTAKKLTQGELGKLVNATKGTISNYENEHSTPSNEMIRLLAKNLDTTTDYLLGHSIEETRSIMGKDVDTSNLSENQRLVLDWAMAQDALSFHDMSKADLEDILENLSVIFEYEKNKRNAKKK